MEPDNTWKIVLNSFATALIMALYPLGAKILIGLAYGRFEKKEAPKETCHTCGCDIGPPPEAKLPDQSQNKLIPPYLTLVFFFGIMNIFRLWYYECHPNCIFMPSPTVFDQCCQEGWNGWVG